MRTFLIACAAAIVIAVVGGLALASSNTPVEKAFANSSTVRVGA